MEELVLKLVDMQQMKGFMEAQVTPPAAAILDRDDNLLAAAGEDETEPPPQCGRETVLLAEDEPMLRGLWKEVLEDHGYEVIEAHDGIEAVEKFRTRRNFIQLLLLDLGLPRMNGKKVYEEIRLLCPGIKALFVSGYSVAALKEKGMVPPGLHLLLKPFTNDALLRNVREVRALDRQKVERPYRLTV